MIKIRLNKNKLLRKQWRPGIEIGGEVNEGLKAELLEEIGVVDGESVVCGTPLHSAAFCCRLCISENDAAFWSKRGERRRVYCWLLVYCVAVTAIYIELAEFAWVARYFLSFFYSFSCVCVWTGLGGENILKIL